MSASNEGEGEGGHAGGGGGGGFSVTVSHSGRAHTVQGLASSATVAHLKVRLEKLTQVQPRNQKLIAKGAVLKDHLTLGASKVASGAKLTLMGNK